MLVHCYAAHRAADERAAAGPDARAGYVGLDGRYGSSSVARYGRHCQDRTRTERPIGRNDGYPDTGLNGDHGRASDQERRHLDGPGTAGASAESSVRGRPRNHDRARGHRPFPGDQRFPSRAVETARAGSDLPGRIGRSDHGIEVRAVSDRGGAESADHRTGGSPHSRTPAAGDAGRRVRVPSEACLRGKGAGCDRPDCPEVRPQGGRKAP